MFTVEEDMIEYIQVPRGLGTVVMFSNLAFKMSFGLISQRMKR